MSDRAKRIALIACILAIMGFVYASIPQDISFDVVVNNTNLAPSGTNERISGNTYWNNNSAIQILLFSHANLATEDVVIELWINGTLVQVASGSPAGVSVPTVNKSISMIIPKGSYYKAVFLNFHHYEWREYPIISGRNGTLTINQTIINTVGGTSFDGSKVDMNGSSMWNGTFNGTLGIIINDTQIQNSTFYARATRQTDYYIEETGSDSNNCTSVAYACKSFQHIFNILSNNSVLYTDVAIRAGHGHFYEQVKVPELFYDGFNVTIYGQMNSTGLGAATGGAAAVAGYNGNLGYVDRTGAGWTTNLYQNRLLMNPGGQLATIASNNATRINYSIIGGGLFTAFTAGQTITYLDWNTTIECNSVTSAALPDNACITLSPNANFIINKMKIYNNATDSGLGNIAVFGQNKVLFNPRYSYIEGFGSLGTVALRDFSLLQTFNSVFVGDGAIIRLEGNSRIFDRNAASNYYMKGATQSLKTAIFLFGADSGNMNEGYYINGVSKTLTSKAIWSLDGSAIIALDGFVENIDSGMVAARFSTVTELSRPHYVNVNTNITPSNRFDNSSIT